MTPKLTLKEIKYGLSVLVFVVLFVRIRSCVTKPNVRSGAVASIERTLPKNDVALITYEHQNISVTTAKGTTTNYVPEGGKASVQITKDGSPKVDVKRFGFLLAPVGGMLVTDRLRLVGGAQVLYFGRLEAYVGVGYPSIIGYVGLGYRMDQLRLYNTSVFVAYTTDKHIGIGLSVRF